MQGTGLYCHDVRGVCNGRDDVSGPCAVIKYCAVMQEETGTAVTIPVNQAGNALLQDSCLSRTSRMC
jgi:hypothetical protein